MNETVAGELVVLIDSAGPLGDVLKELRLVEIAFCEWIGGGLGRA